MRVRQKEVKWEDDKNKTEPLAQATVAHTVARTALAIGALQTCLSTLTSAEKTVHYQISLQTAYLQHFQSSKDESV